MKNSTSGKRGIYYPLTSELAKKLRNLNLHASEWRLWSYLVTLDPFGDRYLELPDLVDVLAECDISKATFYRALAKFEKHELFDIQPLRMVFRNLRGQNNSLTHEKEVSPMRNSDSPMRLPDSPVRNSVSSMRLSSQEENSEPFQTGSFPKSRNVPKQTDQTLKTTKQKVPTTHPDPILNRKEFGTSSQDPLEVDLEVLSAPLREAGIHVNKTIQTSLAELLFQKGSAVALKVVENALSSLQEQEQKKAVRNRGGFINAALKRGFTANGEKKESRQRRQAKQPPDLVTVSLAIDQALNNGDRPFALNKLQTLWTEGWKDEVEELCILRKRDWGFSMTAAGVKDGHVKVSHQERSP